MSHIENTGQLRQREPRAEEWRDIPGYEGRYQASSSGRVRCLERVEIDSLGRRKPIRGKLCTQHVLSTGYLAVNLPRPTYGGRPTKRRRQTVRVHTVVASAFLGPRPHGMLVLHNNGRKPDNRSSNLRYGTPGENNADAQLHGAIKFGTARDGARLTEERVAAIRSLPLDAFSDWKLAAAFEVSPPTIKRARTKGWPHVKQCLSASDAVSVVRRCQRAIVIRNTLPVLVGALELCRTRSR